MARLSGVKLSAACLNVRTNDQYSKKEAQRRAEVALRATFSTPPKLDSEMKLGKRKAKTKKSPGRNKESVDAIGAAAASAL